MIKQEIKSFVMNYSNELAGLKCIVPCSMYSTLTDNGIIGNPYKERNARELERYAQREVTFVAKFRVDATILAKQNVDLHISMLDTLATVRLNGHKIADVSDFYLTYDFAVKNVLMVGENTLEIEIYPATSVALRKPRYMWGTHFSPRLPDMGIYGEVSLIAYDKGYINNVKINQEHNGESVNLHIELDTVGDTNGRYAVATLESPGGKVYFGAFNNNKSVINITSPNLWWPCDMGSQNLYRLSVNLYSDSEIIDAKEVKIGLRSLTYENGVNTVNGTPCFLRGVTYVPSDSVVPFADKKRIRRILESIAEANCNVVRVSALGYYMPDYFYDYCDELGLLVWQDITVIGNVADGVNEEQIRREIRENVSRISHHPSLALVVGAVDAERICLPNEERDNHSLLDLYQSFYDSTVRDFVKDVGVEYSVAMPDAFKDGYCSDTSLSYSADSHSIVALPDIKTLREITNNENINVLSPVIESHQLAMTNNLSFIAHCFARYLYPISLDALIYATQQSAAEEIKLLVDAARRQGGKRGLLTAQANDAWYGISQSTVDYFGRWKAGNYMLKREFAPVLAIAEQRGKEIAFIISNETSDRLSLTLHFAVIDNRNIPLLTDNLSVTVEPSATSEVLKKDLSDVFLDDEDECYLMFYVAEENNILSKSTLMFTKQGENAPVNQKSFKLIKPSIECNIIGNGRDYTLTYKANVYVKNLELAFENTDAVFEDNFFDVTDTQSHRLRIKTEEATTSAKLMSELIVRSAYDVGR